MRKIQCTIQLLPHIQTANNENKKHKDSWVNSSIISVAILYHIMVRYLRRVKPDELQPLLILWLFSKIQQVEILGGAVEK